MKQQHPTFALEETAVQDLVSHLRGALLRPGDAGYEQALRVYKGKLGATLSIEDGLRECREHGWRHQRVEQARVPSRGENGRNGVTVRHAYTLMHTT